MSLPATLLVWSLVAIICAASVWAAMEDAKTKTIPNAACIVVAVAGAAFQLVRQITSCVPFLMKPVFCVVVAVAMLLVLYGIETLLRNKKGTPGLGFGDVKFISAWALILGDLVLLPLAAAACIGAVVAINRKNKTFALGPWLSICFIATLLLVCILR